MLDPKIIQKIGRFGFSVAATVCWIAQASVAGEVQFSAAVDQNKIGLNETVTLNLSVKSDGNAMAREPGFDAPDFEVVNEFNSISVSSQYDSNSGRISMVNHQQISKVLRPLKQGALKISRIQMISGGKEFKSPDIVVQVVPGSRVQAPPVARGGSPSRMLPRMRLRSHEDSAPALVRAELDKPAAYKGEQVVVSYYIYFQGKVFNFQVEKFPTLSGFLREDLESPIMQQRIEPESVMLNGIPYTRALLIRYAAYPLEEGQLSFDPLAIKFNYYASGGAEQEDDPFFGFFQQLTPRVGSAKSDEVKLQVLPLPTTDRPANFSGGIGDFNVVSAVDKYEVRANDALMLTLKVEGKGNIANVQEPRVEWPDTVEMYSSKGKSQANKNGVGQKIFEVLLIPRVPGALRLPPLEFSFFDPATKKYYSKSTSAIDIRVLDPAPGTTLVPVATPAPTGESKKAEAKNKLEDFHGLKPPAGDVPPRWKEWLRFLGYLYGALVSLLMAWAVGEGIKKKLNQKSSSSDRSDAQEWKRLHALASRAVQDLSWQELLAAYDSLSQRIFDALDRLYPAGTRSLPRAQLEEIFVKEKGLSPEIWNRVESLFEYIDLIRFASSTRTESEAGVRQDLLKWVNEGEVLERFLQKIPIGSL